MENMVAVFIAGSKNLLRYQMTKNIGSKLKQIKQMKEHVINIKVVESPHVALHIANMDRTRSLSI